MPDDETIMPDDYGSEWKDDSLYVPIEDMADEDLDAADLEMNDEEKAS